MEICAAAPGEGKRRLGALCARGMRTGALAAKGTVENWRREAELLGMHAQELDTIFLRTRKIKSHDIFILAREKLAKLSRMTSTSGEYDSTTGLADLPDFDFWP